MTRRLWNAHSASRDGGGAGRNLAFSGLAIDTLIIGAVAGALSLPIAVLAHEISDRVAGHRHEVRSLLLGYVTSRQKR